MYWKITDTIRKNIETLLDASKEVGLEINTQKSKCMLLSHHQNAETNYDIKIVNRSFENVLQFTCLGSTETNQNLIQEEIKRRLNSSNSCYHSDQKLSSCCLLPKNLKTRLCKTVILPVVLNACETLSLILREEHRLGVFGNRVL
jgi:hypothetical protein